MADLVNIKDFSGASVPVMTDEVTHGVLGTGQVQVFKQMDGSVGSANMQTVNSSGEALVVQNNQVSGGNSTSATLGANAVFTGVAEDISNYAEIRVTVFSSHASAVNGLSLQQSINGTNWDVIDTYTMAAGETKNLAIAANAVYFRLVYTNGGTAQTGFRVGTVYHKSSGRGSSHRPQDARSNEIDTEEVSSYNMLYNGTTWDRAQGVGGAANVRQPDATATGTIAASNANVTMAVSGASGMVIQITGTWSATLQFEGTVDGTNWFSFIATPMSGSGTGVTSTGTSNVAWAARVAGLTSVRVRASAYTSGTATVNLRASQGTSLVALDATQTVVGTVLATGPAASGSAAITNPVRMGGTARTTNQAAVTDGQTSNVLTDKMGRLVTVTSHIRDMVGVQATTITSSTTATTIVAAAGANVFADLTNLSVTNGSGTPTTVTISDGTVSCVYNVPAGGGFIQAFNPPRKATTANTAWTATCGTSVASIYVNADFVRNL